jgi:hypothetical protein
MNAFVALVYSASVFSSQPAYFQSLFPAEHAAEVIRVTQKQFRADRAPLPIPRSEAVRVVQSSAAAGLGAWCGVEWQAYYLAFMRSERTRGWSDDQLRFIGVLFDTAQGSMQKSMARTPCESSDRESVARMLQHEPNR